MSNAFNINMCAIEDALAAITPDMSRAEEYAARENVNAVIRRVNAWSRAVCNERIGLALFVHEEDGKLYYRDGERS